MSQCNLLDSDYDDDDDDDDDDYDYDYSNQVKFCLTLNKQFCPNGV